MAFSATPVAHGVFTGGANGGSVTINTTGADLIVVFVGGYNAGPKQGPTENKSNGAATALTAQNSTGTNNEAYCQFFYWKNPTVGTSHTFTLGGTGCYSSFEVTAWSGSHLTAPFDTETGSSLAGPANVNNVSIPSVTPSQVNSLVLVGACPSAGSAGTATISAGWTISDQTPYTGGTNEGSICGYIVETSIVAASPNIAWTGNASSYACASAVFKPATTVTSVGTASGSSTASGVGNASGGAAGAGTASASSTATGVAAYNKPSVGTASASSVAVATSPNLTIRIPVPYLATDTLGSKTYDVYDADGNVLSTANTLGFFDAGNGNITNCWSCDVVYNPATDGSFAGVAVFNNINGTGKAAWPLYHPPTSVPSSVIKCDLSPFLSTDTIGSAVAQTLTLSASTVGAGRTATAGGGTPFATGNNPVGKWILSGNGRAQITARTSDTVVTVTTIDAFVGTSISSGAWSFGTPGYQTAIKGASYTSAVTATIWAVPGVPMKFAIKSTFTPDSYKGIEYDALWNTG